MYENGGNTLHRFLDGHPQLFVYPFESQPGTFLVSDHLTSVFPQKYRWPEFSISGSIDEDYELLIDEELKRHVKTPIASKFKNAHLDLKDKERNEIFIDLLRKKPRTRKNIVEAYFVSTFLAWKNYKRSGKEIAYVGYSPIIGVDSEKIFKDFPDAHIIHIVRNPYAGYTETKKRPVPYSLKRYVQTWSIVQLLAIHYSRMFPKNFHLVKFEDMVSDPNGFFKSLSKKIGIKYSDTMKYPSWNGKKLNKVYPWGTIRAATAHANKKALLKLRKEEYQYIKQQTFLINQYLGYDRL